MNSTPLMVEDKRSTGLLPEEIVDLAFAHGRTYIEWVVGRILARQWLRPGVLHQCRESISEIRSRRGF